jgi:hypothetical protein
MWSNPKSDPQGGEAMTRPRPVGAIMADVHNLLGHRCRDACAEAAGCVLGSDETAAQYTVVFSVDDCDKPFSIGVFGMSMCNACVTDTRAALSDDIKQITTTRRGAVRR